MEHLVLGQLIFADQSLLLTLTSVQIARGLISLTTDATFRLNSGNILRQDALENSMMSGNQFFGTSDILTGHFVHLLLGPLLHLLEGAFSMKRMQMTPHTELNSCMFYQ